MKKSKNPVKDKRRKQSLTKDKEVRKDNQIKSVLKRDILRLKMMMRKMMEMWTMTATVKKERGRNMLTKVSRARKRCTTLIRNTGKRKLKISST